MFRKIGIGFCFALLTTFFAVGQTEYPVDWKVEQSNCDDSECIVFTATIEHGWHLYALELSSNEGPLPTEIILEKPNGIEWIGEVKEPTPHQEYDPNFDMHIQYFEEEVSFEQAYQRKRDGKPVKVKGTITYMVCDDEKCLPPTDHHFELTID